MRKNQSMFQPARQEDIFISVLVLSCNMAYFRVNKKLQCFATRYKINSELRKTL